MAGLLLFVLAFYASTLQPAAGQSYQYSCIHYCEYVKYGETQSYCCRMAKVFQKNIFGQDESRQNSYQPPVEERTCPPVRSHCPRAGKFSPPQACTTDVDCVSPDKCCYDKCLELYICKTSVKQRQRRSTSNVTSEAGNVDPGASQAVVVEVTNNGKLFSVVVEANNSPVTVAEGEAITIVGQGPARVSNAENITIVDGASVTDTIGSSQKVKRSIKKENATASNITVTTTDVVSVIKDENGNVIANEHGEPLVLIQKENGGPTVVVNSKGLKVVAGHLADTNNSTHGIVTPTAVPELKAQRRRRRRSAENDVQSSIVDMDGNEVADVNGSGLLKVKNQDKVVYTINVPAMDTEDPVTDILNVSISENDNMAHVTLGEHGATSVDGPISLEMENSTPLAGIETPNRRRRSAMGMAIVDGSGIALTLVNATDNLLTVVGEMGDKLTIVEGDYLLDIGEATMVVMTFNEEIPVLTDEKGMILMDRNGSPLSLKPASSVERSTLKAYCILDGVDKKVNLVDVKGLPVQAFAADGSRVLLCEGLYKLEVGSLNIVHIEKTTDGVFVVTQHGSALTDENGIVLHAMPSESRGVVALQQYMLLDGSGNPIHLITRDGMPTKIVDINGNEIEVKGATKNVITMDTQVTAILENNVLVLKCRSGKHIVDENNLPVTLSPALKLWRKRRAVSGYYVLDSLGTQITLTDENEVQLPLVNEDGEKVTVLSGDTILTTKLTSAVVYRTDEGLYIGDESGNLVLDGEDNPLALVLPSDLPPQESMKIIIDGRGNEVVPVGTNNNLATVVDDEGDEVTVKPGAVKVKIGTHKAAIVKREDGVDRLVDNLGNEVTDATNKPLEVVDDVKKAGTVATHLLLDGEENPVTLKTQNGTAVTMMDDNGKMVVLEGDVELSADIPDVVRTKRSTNEIHIVDRDGYKMADEMGNPLRIKKTEDHLNLQNQMMLVDGEGASLNLVGFDDSPIPILNENDEMVSFVKGEKTLRIEASRLRIMATTETSSSKMLIDENGNAVFSDSGLIEIVETERFELHQSENLMIVTEDFVEMSLSLRRLSASVEEHQITLGESRISAYREVYEELNLFVYKAVLLQSKCLEKMMGILQGQDSAFEAFSLLGEMEEIH